MEFNNNNYQLYENNFEHVQTCSNSFEQKMEQQPEYYTSNYYHPSTTPLDTNSEFWGSAEEHHQGNNQSYLNTSVDSLNLSSPNSGECF